MTRTIITVALLSALATSAIAQTAPAPRADAKAACLAKAYHRYNVAGEINPRTGEAFKRSQCRLDVKLVQAAIAKGTITAPKQ